MPNHQKWQGLFAGLRYVVVDELHTLSGIYGSHVANVLRRLQRICRHYGSNPTFCGASATISNAGEHGRRLFEQPVHVVDQDGSPRGKKHFVFLNPRMTQVTSGMRVPASAAARQVGGKLLASDLQTILFTRSRNQAEVLLKYRKYAVLGMYEGSLDDLVEERVTEASLGYFINPLVSVMLGMIFFSETLRRASKTRPSPCKRFRQVWHSRPMPSRQATHS